MEDLLKIGYAEIIIWVTCPYSDYHTGDWHAVPPLLKTSKAQIVDKILRELDE